MSNVISLLDRLDSWKELYCESDEDEELTLSISLNMRNGDLQFEVDDIDGNHVCFELNNVGIARLQEILDKRENDILGDF